MSESTFKKIPLIEKLGYGAGNFTYGLISQMIGFYIVFYATSVLGISGTLVGLAVSLSVVWDAVTDPVMGFVSDHTKNKYFGKRHLYILFGCICIAVTNYFIWSIDTGWSEGAKFAMLVVLLLLIKTFLTIYTTPYTALGAELSHDYTERTSIQGIRTIFFISGVISATGLGLAVFFKPTAEYANGQMNPNAYLNMGITGAVLALIFGLVCYFTTTKYKQHYKETESDLKEKTFVEGIKEFGQSLRNRDYGYVVLAYLFTNIASGLFSTIGLHVFTFTFGLTNLQISFIFATQFIVCILAQPLWIWIAKKVDKRPAVQLGLSLSVLGSIIFGGLVLFRHSVFGGMVSIEGADHLPFLQEAGMVLKSILPFVPFGIVSGLGVAGLFSLPLSMIADTIDVEEIHTGKRSEGTYYGMLTLAYKASQSVAIFLLGILLDVIKFDPDAAVQLDSSASILGFTITLGSATGFLLALYFISKYTLNAAKIREVQKRLGR